MTKYFCVKGKKKQSRLQIATDFSYVKGHTEYEARRCKKIMNI